MIGLQSDCSKADLAWLAGIPVEKGQGAEQITFILNYHFDSQLFSDETNPPYAHLLT